MIDHSLLKTQYTGRDGFIWWIGKVAPPDVWRDEQTDPQEGWSYRCKVRIIGYHPFDGDTLPDTDLPEPCYGISNRGCWTRWSW